MDFRGPLEPDAVRHSCRVLEVAARVRAHREGAEPAPLEAARARQLVGEHTSRRAARRCLPAWRVTAAHRRPHRGATVTHAMRMSGRPGRSVRGGSARDWRRPRDLRPRGYSTSRRAAWTLPAWRAFEPHRLHHRVTGSWQLLATRNAAGLSQPHVVLAAHERAHASVGHRHERPGAGGPARRLPCSSPREWRVLGA